MLDLSRKLSFPLFPGPGENRPSSAGPALLWFYHLFRGCFLRFPQTLGQVAGGEAERRPAPSGPAPGVPGRPTGAAGQLPAGAIAPAGFTSRGVASRLNCWLVPQRKRRTTQAAPNGSALVEHRNSVFSRRDPASTPAEAALRWGRRPLAPRTPPPGLAVPSDLWTPP